MTDAMLARMLERTRTQRLDSLQKANRVRFARAATKQALRDRDTLVSGLIRTPPAHLLSMRVCALLAAAPGVGPARVHRLMLLVSFSDAKTVGGLSDRQRGELAALLEERGL